MKRSSASLTIREMTIHTPVRDHLMPVGTAIVKKPSDKTFGKAVEKREPLYTVAGNINWHSHYGKECGGSSENHKCNYHMTQHFHLLVCR